MIELSVRHLNVTLQNTPILNDVSLDVENGAFVCIVGPSGAGKSTLLKQLNRLDPGKVGGEILWRGQNIDTYDVHQLRRQIAYIFQKAVMFEGTTEENIRMALQYGPKMSDQETEELYQHASEIAGITPNILKTPASSLSGGQQQRVGIARVMMMAPPVLLLDEPTASLDVETSNHFCQTLKRMKGLIGIKDNIKKTFLMVTHRLEEAKFLGDKILMLEDGKVVEYTDAAQFFTSPTTERGKAFLKAENL